MDQVDEKDTVFISDTIDGDPEKVPSSAAVSLALAAKQDKLISTDHLPEGCRSLYFTESRAVSAVEGFVKKSIEDYDVIKKSELKSSDDLPEGINNVYYQPARVKRDLGSSVVSAGSGLFPTSAAVHSELIKKQDIVKSSDDISEGVKNKFFDEPKVKSIAAGAVQPVSDSIDSLKKSISDLQAQVAALQPQWSDSFKGGTGQIKVIVAVTPKGPLTQTLHFQAGSLVRIDEQTLNPLGN